MDRPGAFLVRTVLQNRRSEQESRIDGRNILAGVPGGRNNVAQRGGGGDGGMNAERTPSGVTQGTQPIEVYRTARVAKEGAGAFLGSSNWPGWQQAASSLE